MSFSVCLVNGGTVFVGLDLSHGGSVELQSVGIVDDAVEDGGAVMAHGVVLMDRAGWHSTDKLKVPKNLTIILLPSRSPELNPVENIWQYLRQNWLSNRVFEDYDAIIEAGCQAWNKLIDQPETITSIGMREWAHTGR